MNNKDIVRIIKLAKDKLEEKISKKEALEHFMRAGILDSNGNFTEPYAILRRSK